MNILNILFILYVRTHTTMSNKFEGSTTYAPGVSLKKKKQKKGVSAKQSSIAYTSKPTKKHPNRKRKTLSDGRVRTVRTNKDGRKVVRVKSAGGSLLKIKKAATDTKKALTKTISGGRYVRKVQLGTGKDREVTSYKGRLRKKFRKTGQGVNSGVGVMTRHVKGSKRSGNRVGKSYSPRKSGNRYDPVHRTTTTTSTNTENAKY